MPALQSGAATAVAAVVVAAVPAFVAAELAVVLHRLALALVKKRQSHALQLTGGHQ